MAAALIITWDYDTAIGQVNSSYPYGFKEESVFQEIENVERILDMCAEFGARMTFACVGFAAEPGQFPYHVPDQIKRIYEAGHEVASHSWKHEWFPFLEREQIRRSLLRSREVLDECIGQPGAVCGFVPPFTRPMSWVSRGALSLGDRVFGRRYPGTDLGSLLKLVHEAGYVWCRVFYRPLWRKVAEDRLRAPVRLDPWGVAQRVRCIPQHYNGFDEPALQLLDRAVAEQRPLVISGHPAGISRQNTENVTHLRSLLCRAAEHRDQGKLEIISVREQLDRFDRSEG